MSSSPRGSETMPRTNRPRQLLMVAFGLTAIFSALTATIIAVRPVPAHIISDPPEMSLVGHLPRPLPLPFEWKTR